MSDLQNSPPPQKRSGIGWFFGGIGLVILLFLLLCCGGVAGGIGFVWYQASSAIEFVDKLKTTQPAKYTGTKLQPTQIDAAWNRCVEARETVAAGKVAALTLSDVELNNLAQERIDADANKALGGMDVIARDGGVKGKISFQDPNEAGKWITLDADLDLAIVGSQLTFGVKSLKDPQGNEAPMSVRVIGEAMLKAGIMEGADQAARGSRNGNQHPDNQIQPTSPLYGLKTLKFTPGNVSIEIDPERVKAHNAAVGKPSDAPLFGNDDGAEE